MSRVLEFLPEALADAEAATRYYEGALPGLGVQFRIALESVCAAIVRHPLLWRERPGGFRRVNVPGFPFYVAYIIRGEHLVVTAIGHGSRHPDYWKRREH